MQARTGCEKVKCTAFGTKTGPKPDSELFFSDILSLKTTKLVAISVFLLKAMDFTPKSTIQPCTDCQKIPKHCFWYQNASNLLQVQNSI
jgi:hypothetical protein